MVALPLDWASNIIINLIVVHRLVETATAVVAMLLSLWNCNSAVWYAYHNKAQEKGVRKQINNSLFYADPNGGKHGSDRRALYRPPITSAHVRCNIKRCPESTCLHKAKSGTNVLGCFREVALFAFQTFAAARIRLPFYAFAHGLPLSLIHI